jgi:AAA domain
MATEQPTTESKTNIEAFLAERGFARLPNDLFHCPKCGAPRARIEECGAEYGLVCTRNGDGGCGLVGGLWELLALFNEKTTSNGNTSAAALALDKSRPPSGVLQAAPAAVLPLTFHDAGDIVQGELELARYRVPGLVADGCISALGGFIGYGKTPFTVRMLKAMLSGDPFLDIEVERVPDDYRIIYLTQESLNTFQPLLRDAGITPEVAAGRLTVAYSHEVFKTQQSWPQIVAGCAEIIDGKGLLIVDTFRTFARLRNERDDSEMTEALRPLVSAVGSGMSAWTNVHSWKGFKDVVDEDADVMHIAGAGALSADSAIIAVYKKPKSDGGNENVRYFKVVRNRFGNELAPRYVELVDNELRVVGHLAHAARIHSGNMQKVKHIITSEPGKTKRELEDATGLTHQRLSDAIKALQDEGLVHGIGKARSRTNPVRFYPGPGPDEDVDAEAAITTPMNTEQIWHEP